MSVDSLLDPNHPRHEQYQQACALKNDRNPKAALLQLLDLLRRYQPGTRAHVEVLNPIAVCQRLTGDVMQAEDTFHQAYRSALEIDIVLAAHVQQNWSALALERGDYELASRNCREVYDMLEDAKAPGFELELAITRGYIGRAEKDVGKLRESVQGLKNEPEFTAQRSDAILWIIELRSWWSLVYVWLALRYAFRGKRWWDSPRDAKAVAISLVDVAVTFVGGKRLRDAVRRRAMR